MYLLSALAFIAPQAPEVFYIEVIHSQNWPFWVDQCASIIVHY